MSEVKQEKPWWEKINSEELARLWLKRGNKAMPLGAVGRAIESIILRPVSGIDFFWHKKQLEDDLKSKFEKLDEKKR